MHSYLSDLYDSFAKNGNADNAIAMKKYMKGQFDYFGIKSPLRKELQRNFLSAKGFPVGGMIEEVVKACWEIPQREFQYFCMELLGRLAKKAESDRIDLYEYLVLEKSWWDTVDYIASNLIGVHFQKYPELLLPCTERWLESGNMWLQRSTLLFQLKYKKETDLELLQQYIHRLTGSKEFFINKAIGWILREYSKTNPEWVIHFVDKNAQELANLSKTEALKWLKNKNRI